ncbi:MAG: aminodeoxychorismate synthase component I [Gemmatimonadota bacterium]
MESKQVLRFDSLDALRGRRSFLFADPIGEVVAWELGDVIPSLERLTRAVERGAHAAGFISYEAGPAFDRALSARPPMPGLPLLWFRIHGSRVAADPRESLDSTAGTYELRQDEVTLTPAAYMERVSRIQELIAAGDTYQVNFTFRIRGRFAGSPLALYRDLLLAQRSAFCAYVPFGESTLVSASPELFLRYRGREIELRPMKGTAPRGRWPEEDRQFAEALRSSPKELAENLMIVDLLRSDLGRVAEFGTVTTPALFETERYPTVHQLTSTINGRLRKGTRPVDLFRALFPSGSVTGAPKVRTTQIIEAMEETPRGPYTGAIGFFGPDDGAFSVAIRTVLLDRRRGRFELGVGSGITADSEPVDEFRECLSKAAFLHYREPQFELLETLRLDVPGGYALLERHLDRLRQSAIHFGFDLDPSAAREALAQLANGHEEGRYKVRLLAGRDGELRTEIERLCEQPTPLRLGISTIPVDADDRFLYHKTTHRPIHERAMRDAAEWDDVILYNTRGEVTETTTANLVLTFGDDRLTPPVESGLLPGTLRAELLEAGRIRQCDLTLQDLERASAIHLINSVRGWRPASLTINNSALPAEASR